MSRLILLLESKAKAYVAPLALRSFGCSCLSAAATRIFCGDVIGDDHHIISTE
jgi:hypothetical protein